MKYEFDPNNIDVIAIDREARRLRAEATRNGVRSLRAWVSGLFAGPAQNTGKTAA